MLLLGVLLLCGQLLAQTRTITGKVTDDKGNPVPNASVVIKGSNAGTSSSESGSFSISVPATAKILVVSAVGMESKEITIGNLSSINIELAAMTNEMESIVVVGYGSGRKLGSVVGSIVKVGSETIRERPTANAFDALQGKVAGLQVFTSNGEPSATSSLRIHGVGSLGASSTPLYVLDGIPVDGGSIISLNPEDFESISVLKDASATAIYGSRAANGVIYITTKKGSARESTISLQTQYGVSNLINTDFFNGFMNTKQLTDFWVETGYRRRGQIDTLLTQFPFDTKWYKAYYQDNVPMYQGNLSISGGGGKTTYYISGGYFKQEGLAYRSDFERYTLRSNITTTVNKWLKLGLNLSGGFDKRQTNPYGTNSTNRGLALLAAPFYSPVDANGVEYPDLIPGWNRYNPKYLADKNPSEGNNAQFNPNAYIQINPIEALTLKTQVGMDAYDYRSNSIRLPSNVTSLNNGSVSESFSRGVMRTINNTAEYKFDIQGKHNFIALAGNEYIDFVSTAFSGSSTGQTDDRLVLISNGPSNRDASSSKSEYSYLSYFSRINYNFDEKYYFDVSFRQDKSSRFGRDNRTANFWSVGGMWKASEEEFLSNVSWLSNLTVKASYGTSGNSAIGNYQSLGLVGTNQYENQTGFAVSSPGNPLLSWESQTQANFGLDFSLFNRANITVEYYDRVTKDMLIDVPYPYTSGFSSVIDNVGSLKNSGIDLSISGDVYKSKKAYITPYINFNYNNNKVTELFQGKQYWIIPNTGVSWAVGQPVSYFYPVFAQVNSETGLPEWYLPNENPDEIVNPRQDKDNVTTTFNPTALQQNTGIKRYPPFNGGFGLSAGYSGFYLQSDFSFSQGKYLINNDRYFFENPTQFPGFNQSTVILDYWKAPGDVARFPKYGTQFTQFDSRLIEDASFLRLKALTVGYTFPASMVKGTKVLKGARVYATGRNLLTFTKYSGPDPEVDSNLTLGVNPNTKQYSFGLDLQF